MPKRRSQAEHLAELKAFVGRPEMTALQLTLATGSEEIDRWLGNLRLLVGVPFRNLVADERMLPTESIRFFYVDDNWLDALEDGATSIGLRSTRDRIEKTRLRPLLDRRARAAARVERRRRLDRTPKVEGEAEADAGGTVTGFVLRSALVSGWPGLEVAAFADVEGETPIDLLRLERLSPDVMLCLLAGDEGLPRRIDLDEPSEGLQFGVIERDLPAEEEGPENPGIAPRYLGLRQPERAGKVITLDREEWVAPVMRDEATRVLDVAGTKAALESKLVALDAIDPGYVLTPADFAVEMVKSPERQSFERDAGLPLVAAAEPAAEPAEKPGTGPPDGVRAIGDAELVEALIKSHPGEADDG